MTGVSSTRGAGGPVFKLPDNSFMGFNIQPPFTVTDINGIYFTNNNIFSAFMHVKQCRYVGECEEIMHLPFEEGYRQEAKKYLFRANILKYGFFVSTDGGVRMRDADKTKGQLIEELARLRREIARLQRDNKRQYLRAQLVESLPEDIVITDLEGNIVDVNKAAELSTGYSRRELTGKNPIIFNASENAKAIERQIMDCLQQSRIWSGEMLQRDRYGNKRMSEFGIFPIKDGDETIALGSIKRDITEQKRMQRALRENEKKIQNALQ